MLGTTNRGSQNPSSALTVLIPRQVLLAERRSKTNPKTNPTSATMTNKYNDETLALGPKKKCLLLHSILKYLERNSFSKTLKKFISEAQIEDDSWKASSLDLEEMCCKYLETFNGDTNFKTLDKKEEQTETITKRNGYSNCAASEETVVKKKKTDERDDNAANYLGAVSNSEEKLANDDVTESHVKSKEKKGKKNSDFHNRTERNSEESKEPDDDTVHESQKDESSKKHTGKKKKKSKLTSKSLDENMKQEQLDSLTGLTGEKSKDLVSPKDDGKTDTEVKVVSKDKKKKTKPSTDSLVEDGEQFGLEDKNGVVSDSALGNTSGIPLEKEKVKSKDKKRKKGVLDEEKSIKTDIVKESFQTSEDAANKAEKDSKKRKKSVLEENEDKPVEKLLIKESKRRKTEDSKDTKLVEQFAKANGLPGGDGHTGKESKGGNGQDKPGDEHLNGSFKKKGAETSAQQQSMRKQSNSSAQPKTVNAFRRVKADEVVFTDERLQDNSYWAKDGAEVGYGAKAQEVLGQVRGRDFRHEKTKKKRGSYRGGQIDLHSHSVKFNYSDDD